MGTRLRSFAIVYADIAKRLLKRSSSQRQNFHTEDARQPPRAVQTLRQNLARANLQLHQWQANRRQRFPLLFKRPDPLTNSMVS